MPLLKTSPTIPAQLWIVVNVLAATVITVPVTLDDAPGMNSLPDVMRRTGGSSLVTTVVNGSMATDLEDEAVANASSSLSNTTFSDIENDNLTHVLQMRYRERKKQERITLIRSQILTRLHMNGQPNISTSKFSHDDQLKIASMIERLQSQNELMAQQGTIPANTIQWLQSFYPSCNVPNNTDWSSWEQEGAFRLFYDVPFNKFPNDVTILMAKLRLYKITGVADPNFEGWDSTRPRHNVFGGLINSRAANGISVNVYQYFKPLRSNKREKKRLIDSRIVAVDFRGWIDFNLEAPLNFWYRHGSRNFGLDVEVEDAFGHKLNPNLYFENLNCSYNAPRDSPFPNLMQLHRGDLGQNESSSSLFDNETYPTLDLRTAQLPRVVEDINARIEDEVRDRILRKRSTENSTCRKELEYVSFSDIGLDEYIMWPQGVLWTFCDGGCDPNEITEENREYFFSSWLQRYLRLKRKTGSDCTVTRRESLPVILYDGENKVIDTVLEDFVPVNCGCRAS